MPQHAFKTIFIFLGTDKHVSAFDILTAMDVFPDAAIVKYENVTVEDVEKIVHDAIFPRGPEGAKHTKIFITGRDFEIAKAILDRAQNSMFPPFELSVVIDPGGAYTTASAAVARILETSLTNGLGGLSNKSVSILAGTGPVGQTAARLFVGENANVVITSRELKKSSAVVTMINEELQSQRLCGVEAQSPEEIGEAIRNADIVLSTGAVGVTLLPLSILKQYGKKSKIVADINAIQPLGVEGLRPEADGTEILPGVFGIGALAIGKRKNRVEVELIRRATREPKGIFDYRAAYDISKKTILGKPKKTSNEAESPEKHWLP